MLIRSALAAGLLAASAVLSSLQPAHGAPPPMDGSVRCAAQRCRLVVTSPGRPSRVSHAHSSDGPRRSSRGFSVSSRPSGPTLRQSYAFFARKANAACLVTKVCLPPLPRFPGQPARPGQPQPVQPAFTPGDATRQALRELVLPKPKIGSAPCHEAGCRGSVGVPVWLWTAPWQSPTATATAGPFTVTARATPRSVTWDLGDGQVITCTTPGTQYRTSMGWRDSPDCGTRYERVGEYAITATMTYDVTWSGADSGSQTMTTTSTTPPIHVGEIQVLIDKTS